MEGDLPATEASTVTTAILPNDVLKERALAETSVSGGARNPVTPPTASPTGNTNKSQMPGDSKTHQRTTNMDTDTYIGDEQDQANSIAKVVEDGRRGDGVQSPSLRKPAVTFTTSESSFGQE